MSPLGLLAALVVGFVLALIVGFVVEAANEFGNAPKSPQRIPASELKALVRREFARSPIPDDSELRIAAAILEGQS